MSDLICRKTMMRCQTPGMCAPQGGCSTSAEAARAALAERAVAPAPAEGVPGAIGVKRYELHFAADSMLKVDDAGRFVLASDYDAMAQRCRELEADLAEQADLLKETSKQRDFLDRLQSDECFRREKAEAERDALARRCAELEHSLAVKEEFYQDALHSHISLASQRNALRAEVERLRHALERINARAEAYTEDGRGMTECSTLVVAEIARTALETTK